MLAKARSQKEIAEKNRALKEKASAKSSRKSRRRGGQLIEAELLRDPEDIRLDARYGGQTEILIKYVPLKSVDESTEVDAVSLREWVIYAIVEEDPASQVFFDQIQRYNDLIADIEVNMKKIPKLQFYDENGKLKTEAESRLEREELFKKQGEELAQAESGLDEVNRQLKEHVEWRKTMGVILTMIDSDKNTQTATWLLQLSGTDDVQDIEDSLIQKRNWQGIKLAVAYRKKDPPLPPWVGRGDVPDGKNPTLPNYTGLEVNMLGVRIMRIPAGIGLYRHLDRKSSNIAHDQFGLYYGEYEHGAKSGFGIQINDSGVYSGGFERGFKSGHGRMDYADGTTIIGTFDTKLQSSLPETTGFQNPYLDGEPHGFVEIYYADGGYYRGHMINGEITGQGDYQSAFNEVLSGTFQQGLLHGKNNFRQTAAEEVFMGSFVQGELHGPGTFLSDRTGDSYEGYWHHGLRHGRGISKFKDMGCHRGYYVNGIKHGKGSLEYGTEMGYGRQTHQSTSKRKKRSKKKSSEQQPSNNANETAEIDQLKSFNSKMKTLSSREPGLGNSPSREGSDDSDEEDEEEREDNANHPTKKSTNEEHDYAFSEFDNIYQGFFLGNNVSNQGSIMNMMKQLPSIISRLDKRKIYPIQQVLGYEYRQQKKSDQILEKYSDFEYFLRKEIMAKKLRIYQQQKHFAKKVLYQEDVYNYFDYTQYEQKLQLRQERLTKFSKVNEQSDLYYFKKAKIPRLKQLNCHLFQSYTQSQQKLQPHPDGSTATKVDDYINQDLLKTIFSDFEEVRERQRFLKYDLIWQRAEAAYESNQKSHQ